jgi:hypothetical protein
MGFLKHYWIDLLITAVAIVAVGIWMGPLAIIPLVILLILEISFSFDNAVVNAKVLVRMSRHWQLIFLTVGIFIAVGVMRFVFPIGIVAATSGLGFGDVVTLALNDPHGYAEELHDAHALIAMFGGVYLLLIFLNFIFEDREVRWIKFLEQPLAKAGEKSTILSYAVTGTFILVAALTFGAAHQAEILLAGFMSMVIYMIVKVISDVLDQNDDEEVASAAKGKNKVRHGWAAFGLFMYLEFQDAAFSFDGVTAAFAVTDSVVLIAIGLGIGALFVRSMTVHLVRTGHLETFRFLEHGAHWAIGILAVCMLIGVSGFEISEFIVGTVGVVFIIASVLHSRKLNKREASELARNLVADEPAQAVSVTVGASAGDGSSDSSD